MHGVFPLAPRPYALCEDATVIGAVFYAMERRRGLVGGVAVEQLGIHVARAIGVGAGVNPLHGLGGARDRFTKVDELDVALGGEHYIAGLHITKDNGLGQCM